MPNAATKPAEPTASQQRALVRALVRRFGQSVMPYEFDYRGCSVAEGEHWRVTDVETGSYVQGVFHRYRLQVRREHDGTKATDRPLAGSADDKSAGQAAYEADCAIQPAYHDGQPRKPWARLCSVTKGTWERNPTTKSRALIPAPAMVPQVCQQWQADAGRDWISPADRMPARGQPVEMSVFSNDREITLGRWLGENWWIYREVGGDAVMVVPPAPAYWRPIKRVQKAAA